MVFEIKKDKEKFGEFLMSNGGGGLVSERKAVR